MSITTIDWTLWRSFLAVAEEGGLSQAARALGLTQPTVGRHIDQLEAALGGALFTRSRSGMTPTARARALIPEAAAMAASALALSRTGRGDPAEARGVVRISASEIVGTEVLPAALAPYRRDWPGVEIELSLTNAPEDLLNRAADIANRMTRPTQQRLIA
ncbi:MAG: LysR family transcriptional regulator, partial [Pseudomonadota bacterium]